MRWVGKNLEVQCTTVRYNLEEQRENTMDEKTLEQVKKELTMMLMYLSRFQDRDIPEFCGRDIFNAWKGYDFDILNELEDVDYIRQGKHPSRSKSVFITEEGIEKAKKLLQEYGINE